MLVQKIFPELARQQPVVSMLMGTTGGWSHNPHAVSHEVKSCMVSCLYGDNRHCSAQPSPAPQNSQAR